jgi:hydroxymethylpyrimidine/phosphomethylpyrimidine kinase
MTQQPVVLVIAGSDSSGGAGLIRDVEVLRDCGVAATCAITAVTAQTHSRVATIHEVPAHAVQDQILCAFETHRIGAIKIGMLATQPIVDTVAQCLEQFRTIPCVLDPVLCSSSGRDLLDERGRTALTERLLPLATLVTPNIPEAARLVNAPPAQSEPEMLEHARQITRFGAKAVLLKGGHATGPLCVDVLLSSSGELERFSAPRFSGTQRGTGCTLASAITAALAKGSPLTDACRSAKRYVTGRLAQAPQIGNHDVKATT